MQSKNIYKIKKKTKKPSGRKNREARPTALQPISVIMRRVVAGHDCIVNVCCVLVHRNVFDSDVNMLSCVIMCLQRCVLHGHGSCGLYAFLSVHPECASRLSHFVSVVHLQTRVQWQ